MFAFFCLFFAMYLLSGALLRLLQTQLANTSIGAALAFIH